MRNGLLGILVGAVFILVTQWAMGYHAKREALIPSLKEAKVLEISCRRTLDSNHGNNSSSKYKLSANYEYEVEGQLYGNSNIWWVSGGSNSMTSWEADELIQKIESKTTIYYNPADPSDSAILIESESSQGWLRFGLSAMWWLGLVVGGLAFGNLILHIIQFKQGKQSSLWIR